MSRFFSGLFILSLLLPGLAHAACQDVPTPYDAGSRRLDEALQDFAHHSGCFVHVLPDQERGQSAHRIHGRYRPADALAALLEGTPLKAVRTSEGFRLVSVTPTRTSSDQDARKPTQTDGSKAQPAYTPHR
ncbi:MAG: STN domain-containing protein [Acetobacter aceti]|uniref:STN domain-containing protein n=1 Tax=Gluconobacter oxydans TaxID=442 RepID=UPI0039E9C8FC